MTFIHLGSVSHVDLPQPHRLTVPCALLAGLLLCAALRQSDHCQAGLCECLDKLLHAASVQERCCQVNVVRCRDGRSKVHTARDIVATDHVRGTMEDAVIGDDNFRKVGAANVDQLLRFMFCPKS